MRVDEHYVGVEKKSYKGEVSVGFTYLHSHPCMVSEMVVKVGV